MKKIIAVISLFVLSLSTYAQRTTNQEYLYLTKGLKIQLESGLDMKKGYEIKEFKRMKVDRYTFDFRFLIRENKKYPFRLAGIIVSVHSEISGRDYIKIIPIGARDGSQSDFSQKYYDSIDDWDARIQTAYAIALSSALTANLIFPEYYSKIINE